MSCIVIAFSKTEHAQNIKRILSQSGYSVTAACTTGAAALQNISRLEQGILICGSRFADMVYTELYEYLPPGIQMLLLASPAVVSNKEIKDIVCLEMPLKVHELLETVKMMEYSFQRLKKKQHAQPKGRTEEERLLLQKAKRILMERNALSEEEAHRYIQKRSMDNGVNLIETAQMILSLMDEG